MLLRLLVHLGRRVGLLLGLPILWRMRGALWRPLLLRGLRRRVLLLVVSHILGCRRDLRLCLPVARYQFLPVVEFSQFLTQRQAVAA